MHIRPATIKDIPRIAQIGATAFAQEPIYARFFPWRAQYPLDFLRFFQEDITKMLMAPGEVVMVAETDESDGNLEGSEANLIGGSKVVAYATFVRHGNAQELAQWKPDTLYKKFQRLVISLCRVWNNFFRPNRAIHVPTIQEYYRQASLVHAKSTQGNPSKLEFRTLAVDEVYQRRGYGEKLVEWCGLRAWKDDIPVFGDASTKGLSLYLRNGCEDIGRIVLLKESIKAPNNHDPTIDFERLEVVVLRWKA